MSLLHCSLAGTASNWYDSSLNQSSSKNDWSSSLQIFKNQFHSQRHAYNTLPEALSLVKKTKKVKHYALKLKFFLNKDVILNTRPP